MHPRTAILGAIAARLSGEIEPGRFWTPAEDRVFADRLQPLDQADLPALRVYARAEAIADGGHPIAGENGVLERRLGVVVEAVEAATPGADHRLDALASGIEAALEWIAVSGLESATIRLAETEFGAPADGPPPAGVLRLVFSVAYRTPWRVTADDGTAPEGVFAGVAPAIGAGHAEDYTQLTGAGGDA